MQNKSFFIIEKIKKYRKCPALIYRILLFLSLPTESGQFFKAALENIFVSYLFRFSSICVPKSIKTFLSKKIGSEKLNTEFCAMCSLEKNNQFSEMLGEACYIYSCSCFLYLSLLEKSIKQHKTDRYMTCYIIQCLHDTSYSDQFTVKLQHLMHLSRSVCI